MFELRFPLAACVLLCLATDLAQAGESSRIVNFAQDVQPILIRNCDRCHGVRNQEGGLQLNLRESVFGKADSDLPIVVKRDAKASLLIKRISGDELGDVMPIDSHPLSPREIETIRLWIRDGADWPDSLSIPKHWAYQSIVRPDLPANRTDSAVDYFVRRRLKSRGLDLSTRLDRPRLIRRLSLALTGIPPTPSEVDEFVLDESEAACETVVDRLLDSHRYGERWAVPWLDHARYADSNGFQADQIRQNWAYRDWVIRAFNDDMPFDQFVIDQIAGDLREDATIDQRIATGFHRMTTCNVEAGVHPEQNRVNQVVDRVNTTATVFLGTTLECAQCHNHKYDPFSQRDYYKLFAYFNNTPLEVKKTSGVTWDFYGPKMKLSVSESQELERDAAHRRWEALKTERQSLADAADEPFQAWLTARKARDKENTNLDRLRTAFEKKHPPLQDIDQRIDAAKATIDRLAPVTTLVMIEMTEPRETFVMIRGDYENLGQAVAAGTPEKLPAADSEAPGDRMQLARWLTSTENPLPARVTVNRWWAELLGRGIVSTPEDFGTQGDSPTHPELLDWLASELIASGWSMKQIHKTIVMSNAFQQTALTTPELLEADPDNRWISRGPRFRLSAELVRDNALAVSGLLSEKMFGPPIMPYQPDRIWRSVGRNQPKWETATDEDRFRRGVYVVWKRAAPYPSFVNFDAPNRGSCTVNRGRSNTPLQALTLLNDPAYTEMAFALAARIIREAAEPSDEQRIQFAVRTALSRSATVQEFKILEELLDHERELINSDPSLVAKRTADNDLAGVDAEELTVWFAVANALLNLDELICQ